MLIQTNPSKHGIMHYTLAFTSSYIYMHITCHTLYFISYQIAVHDIVFILHNAHTYKHVHSHLHEYTYAHIHTYIRATYTHTDIMYYAYMHDGCIHAHIGTSTHAYGAPPLHLLISWSSHPTSSCAEKA